MTYKSENKLPLFTLTRQPSIHLPFIINSVTKAVDFFSLCFTNELIETICKHTDSYARSVIEKKQYDSQKECA